MRLAIAALVIVFLTGVIVWISGDDHQDPLERGAARIIDDWRAGR